MSFGHQKLYPFPAVQYIPLTLTAITRGIIEKDKNPDLQTPRLVPGFDPNHSWDAIQPSLSADLASLNDPDSYPLLALHLEIDDIKYRGFYLTMTGRATPGYYQFYTIPKHYFYKKHLFFKLYDAVTTECLATAAALLT